MQSVEVVLNEHSNIGFDCIGCSVSKVQHFQVTRGIRRLFDSNFASSYGLTQVVPNVSFCNATIPRHDACETKAAANKIGDGTSRRTWCEAVTDQGDWILAAGMS